MGSVGFSFHHPEDEDLSGNFLIELMDKFLLLDLDELFWTIFSNKTINYEYPDLNEEYTLCT